ncbi:MFS transporter [Curtobacterium sp. NPDC089185]|uniref:MFS transporter n=1 Tax=Curtobacterium sp. NPDC089185 TaxID=3154968 RepID=UPI00342418F8
MTNTKTTTTPASQSTRKSRDQERPLRTGWILATLAVTQLMVVLDGTIVNIALPSAQADLGFTDAQRQWAVTSYALAFGSLLLLGGRLADLFGRKATFITGLVGFAVASAIAGAATNLEFLIAGRALQGAFGALVAPASLALLTTTFTEPKARARAFGVFGAVAGAGGAIGLVLGGALTEYTSWRLCLLVNLLFAAVTILGAVLFIPKQTKPEQTPRLDALGTVLIVLGLVSIVYGFSSAAEKGWGAAITLVPLAAGVVLTVAFCIVQTRVAHPLLPLRVVTDRDRGGAFITLALVGAALLSVFLFVTYYLQVVRGYTPLQSGVAFLPMPLSIMLSSVLIAPRLLTKFGPKVVIITGVLFAAAALMILTTTSLTSNYWVTIGLGLFTLGLGLGNIFGASFNLATAGVRPADAGVASAMVNTVQQVGGAIGTAILSTVAQAVASDYVQANGTGARQQLLAQLSSYHTAYLVSAAVLVLIAITMTFVLRSKRARESAS